MIALLVERGPEVRRVEFEGETVVIGRDEACDLPLDDDRVSRRHLRLERGSGGLWAEDLGSANGTFRERARVFRVRFARGERLTIGATRITSLFEHEEPLGEEQGTVLFDLQRPGQEKGLFEVAEFPCLLGRSDAAGLPLAGDEEISERHAVLGQTAAGMLIVTDQSSANGTWRNGARVKRASLHEGDTLRLGGTELVVLGVSLVSEALPRGFEVPHVRLWRLLARGARSRAYLGEQENLGREVVVRVLRPSLASDPAARDAWEEALRGQARVHHPVPATLIESGESEGLPWALVESLEGRALPQIRSESLGLPPERVARWLRDLAEMLQVLHRERVTAGVLTPRRFVVDEEGHLRLTSFGLATRRLEDWAEHEAFDLAFVAPELRDPERPPDARSDLFSLGALGLHLLGVRRPRAGSEVAEILEAFGRPLATDLRLPPAAAALRKVLVDLVAQRPLDRPEDAASVREALAEVVRGLDGVGAGASGVAPVAPVAPAMLAAPRGRTGPGPEAPGLEEDGLVEVALERPRQIKHTAQTRLISWGISAIIVIVLNGGLFLGWRSWKNRREKENDPPASSAPAAPEPPETGARGAAPDDPEPASSRDEVAGVSGDPGESGGPRPRAETAGDAAPEAVPGEIAERKRLYRNVREDLGATLDLAEAQALIAAFVKRFPGTEESAALQKEAAKLPDKWRARAREELDLAEKHLEAGELRLAQERLHLARRVVRGVAEERHARLGARLKEAREAAAKRAAPAEPQPVAPELRSVFALALSRPLDAAGRDAALREADRAEGDPVLAGALVVLRAVGTEVERLRAEGFQKGFRLQIRLRGDQRLAGEVVARSPRMVRVQLDGGGDLEIDLDQLPLAAWVQALDAAAAPGLSTYLARAWLHHLVGQRREVWFDLCGAEILLDADSGARVLVPAWKRAWDAGEDRTHREFPWEAALRR
jgi:pSer/pThr/pTyr-binding forkhead associated (FHA) protein